MTSSASDPVSIPCRALEELLHPFLDGELSDDQRRVVERHLAHCSSCGRAFELLGRLGDMLEANTGSEATDDVPTNPGAHRRQPPASSLPSTLRRLGHYDVEGLIGQGAMGSVLKGLDTILERPVALKLIHEHLADDETLMERFFREARLVARLNHPGICQAYQMGEDERTGLPFIAMEYIEGTTLSRLVKTHGPLAPARAVAIVRQVAVALGEAGKKGIVHRDVKPSNIMVTSSETAKLLDFGLARALGSPSDLTNTGAVLGTPSFIAPEVLFGDPADHRSDIYSLGVTLYFALTGTYPYGTTNTDLIVDRKLGCPVPDVRHLRPRVPRGLARVIKQMMALQPFLRPASCDEVVEAFDGLTSKASTPTSPTLLSQKRRPHRSRRLGAIATVCGLCLAIVAAVPLLLARSEAPRPLPRSAARLVEGTAGEVSNLNTKCMQRIEVDDE